MSSVNSQWVSWSIALYVAWALVLIVRWKIKRPKDFKTLLYVFYGFVIGWLTTTIKFMLINK